MGIILSQPPNVHDDISTSTTIHGDMGIILSQLQMSMMIHGDMGIILSKLQMSTMIFQHP